MGTLPVEWTWLPNHSRFQHDLVAEVLLNPLDGSPGWIPMSLCLHDARGVPGGPFSTSTWVRWPTAPAQPVIRFLSHAKIGAATEWIESEADSGRYPYLVGAAGPVGDARFSLVTSNSAHPTRPFLDGGRPVRRSIAMLGIPMRRYGL